MSERVSSHILHTLEKNGLQGEGSGKAPRMRPEAAHDVMS